MGQLEAANNGTLFLDEIGDTAGIAGKVICASRWESDHSIIVRFIAAKNKVLEQMVASREFREDLYNRLHCHTI